MVGCAPEVVAPRAPTLRIFSPVVGWVSVGEALEPVGPLAPASLRPAGPPPYVVTLEHAGGRLTVMDVPGPEMDLGLLLGARPAVRGDLQPLTVRALDADAVVAVSAGQVFPGVATDGDWLLALPRTDLVRVFAVWTGEALSVAEIPSVAAVDYLELSQRIPLTRSLVVDVAGAPDAFVEVELTLDGLRTGAILHRGVASARGAVGASVPPVVPALEGAGLWVQATGRDISGVRVAQDGVHLRLGTTGHRVVWRSAPDVAPRPRRGLQGAFLGRAPFSLQWEEAPASWVEVSLDGTDGCARATWRVVAPAEPGELSLPRLRAGDPLALPLVRGRFERVQLEGLGYAEVLAPGATDRLGRGVTRQRRRAVMGVWRGGEASCEPSPLAGEYAAYGVSACDADGVAPRVVIDRCGHVVPLSGGGPARCGHLAGAWFDDRAGGRARVEVADDGAIGVASPGAPWRLVPVPRASGSPPLAVIGDWFRYETTSRRLDDPGPDGRARLREGGDVAGGPWLRVGEDGGVRLRTPRYDLEAAWVSDEEGLGVEVIGPGCEGVPRRLAVRPMSGALEMTERVSGPNGVTEWRLRFER